MDLYESVIIRISFYNISENPIARRTVNPFRMDRKYFRLLVAKEIGLYKEGKGTYMENICWQYIEITFMFLEQSAKFETQYFQTVHHWEK